MTGRWLALMLAGATGLASIPARATTTFEQDFVCPVGGEKFESYVIGSYSSWGQRPDGRSYGTLPIYPIVECPGNGFLLFQEEFTPEDIARLEPLVASAEFQAMRSIETPNYRVWWLRSKLGREPIELASSLLRASWESDQEFERKARYQAAFVAAATGLQRTDANAETWFWFNVRAANALRELGHFDQAALLLDRVDRPERLPTDPEQLEGARYLIDGLRKLVAENNPVPEPANLIPAREAALRCVVHRVAPSPSEQVACASAEVREAIAEFQVEDERGNDLTGEAAIRYILAGPDAEPGAG
jgi:hypothetical protein